MTPPDGCRRSQLHSKLRDAVPNIKHVLEEARAAWPGRRRRLRRIWRGVPNREVLAIGLAAGILALAIEVEHHTSTWTAIILAAVAAWCLSLASI